VTRAAANPGVACQLTYPGSCFHELSPVSFPPPPESPWACGLLWQTLALPLPPQRSARQQQPAAAADSGQQATDTHKGQEKKHREEEAWVEETLRADLPQPPVPGPSPLRPPSLRHAAGQRWRSVATARATTVSNAVRTRRWHDGISAGRSSGSGATGRSLRIPPGAFAARAAAINPPAADAAAATATAAARAPRLQPSDGTPIFR
jgi:hypothetical protein